MAPDYDFGSCRQAYQLRQAHQAEDRACDSQSQNLCVHACPFCSLSAIANLRTPTAAMRNALPPVPITSCECPVSLSRLQEEGNLQGHSEFNDFAILDHNRLLFDPRSLDPIQ